MKDDIDTVREALEEFADRTGQPEHAFDRIVAENERLRVDLDLSRRSLNDVGEAYESAMDENERLREELHQENERLRDALQRVEANTYDDGLRAIARAALADQPTREKI